MKTFYITTTLPYVNAEPHIGHALEFIRADIIARAKKLQGFEVFFNTGTDEHGQKVWQKALELGLEAKAYADNQSENFKKLLAILNISEDIHFIRTTDEHHVKATQEFWRLCDKAGDIYKKDYKTRYCVGCELEKTDSEVENGYCKIHTNLKLEVREEENYFFRFSRYGERLTEFYKNNQDFMVPGFRLNEAKALIQHGLEDFSISRLKEKMPWGVPVPDDSRHVMYVWFDALVNYISTLGWPEDVPNYEKFWKNGTPVQYAGKDQVRQQAVMWQAMLMSAGLDNSYRIVINGFINSGGQKMSKSLGNVIYPEEVVREFGADALRYFVSRDLSTFEDSDFTWERFKESYNANLANGLGNLVSRILKLAEMYLPGPVSVPEQSIPDEFMDYMNQFEIGKAIDLVWQRIGDLDKRIQETEPFKLVKMQPKEAKKIIEELTVGLYTVARMLHPFMPEANMKIKELIKANKSPQTPLFPRKD